MFTMRKPYDFTQTPADVLSRAANIQCLVLDVDGVMTDGGLMYSDDGQELKRFHARDGFGLRLWRESGFQLAMVTARKSSVVEHRASELGVTELHQAVSDKLTTVSSISKRLSMGLDQMAFMGDDMVDYRAMRSCGLGLTVADAHPEVVKAADWQSTLAGGNGAIREACELLLFSKQMLQSALQRYSD